MRGKFEIHAAGLCPRVDFFALLRGQCDEAQDAQPCENLSTAGNWRNTIQAPPLIISDGTIKSDEMPAICARKSGNARDACLLLGGHAGIIEADGSGVKRGVERAWASSMMEAETMDFGEQLKKIRTDKGQTQEQIASKLNVSRQTISNWENNKNLPDLEMIVRISMVFDFSLDQLILGGEPMNNMTEKLIKDGSETRRAKINLISIIIGAALLCIGLACILIKANSVEYIDAQGILHENFFLLPIGFFFIFSGMITFLVTGIRNMVAMVKNRKHM